MNRHLRDIRSLYQNPSRLRENQASKFRKLLSHAIRTTQFYSGYTENTQLADIPVLSKHLLRSRQAEVLSSAYSGENLPTVGTSGSYNVRITFYLSPEKKARRSAEVIHFNTAVGYQVGMRYALVNGRSTAKKTPFECFKQNEVVISLPALTERALEAACLRLLQGDIRLVIGWPSIMGPVARHLTQTGRKLNGIKAVLSMGETLTDTTKEEIAQAFDCPVYSRYACNEFGVLAHELPGIRGFFPNSASYIIEILALDSLEPVATGELGRIVVTDLYSQAMPLIRYDTGDFGWWLPPNRDGISNIGRVEGRLVEALSDAHGNTVSPLTIGGAMRKSERDKMNHYQIVQQGQRNYHINYVPGINVVDEGLIAEDLKLVLGAEAEVVVNRVESIPPLPSGKRASVVNNYNRTRV